MLLIRTAGNSRGIIAHDCDVKAMRIRLAAYISAVNSTDAAVRCYGICEIEITGIRNNCKECQLMPVPLLSARSMTDMVNNIKPASQSILDLVFKNHKQHYTDTVDILYLKANSALQNRQDAHLPAGVVMSKMAKIN